MKPKLPWLHFPTCALSTNSLETNQGNKARHKETDMNTTIVSAPTATKVIVKRDGKIYTAFHDAGFVLEVTSSGHGNGRFRSYTADKCPGLFADVTDAIAALN